MNYSELDEEQLAQAFAGKPVTPKPAPSSQDENASKPITTIPDNPNTNGHETSEDSSLSSNNSEPTREEGFDFKDPVELLMFLDDNIASGKDKLYPWQEQFMIDFACKVWDRERPFKSLVRAANGSGKDKYIVAACAVWLCMAHMKAWSIVTSSSGAQLDTQTCKHITHLCQKANQKIDPGVWKINYRHYTCLATGSPIDCFATDEAGKAEGYHPIDTDCKLALFMSEAKTVTDEINEAYDRCNGYTHRVHVSSPGPSTGHFFDDDCMALNRKDIRHIAEAPEQMYVKYIVTAYDCPHIARSHIEYIKNKYGETSAFFRSSMGAEFSSLGEQIVIDGAHIKKCQLNPAQWVPEPYNKAGLDLADGGDETVLIIRNGNRVLEIIPFQLDTGDATIAYLDQLFREKGLNHQGAYIYADCGGLGKPILDVLKNTHYWHNIRYVDNRHAAIDKKVYYKRATEMWFSMKKWFERGEIILPPDKKLVDQLAGRYYKIRQDGTSHLLSKVEQKAKGYKSPDRADSLILAFADYKFGWIEPKVEEDKVPFKVAPSTSPVSEFNMQEYAHRTQKVSINMTSNWRPAGGEYDYYKDEIARYNQRVLEKQLTERN